MAGVELEMIEQTSWTAPLEALRRRVAAMLERETPAHRALENDVLIRRDEVLLRGAALALQRCRLD